MTSTTDTDLDQLLRQLEEGQYDPSRAEFSDTARILSIPVFEQQSPDLTSQFALPGGGMRLYPIQSQALYEAYIANGLLGLIGVGHGKTLLSLLLPRLWNAKRPVLLIPPQMAEQFEAMKETYAQSFRVARHIQVVPYSKLSVVAGAQLLNEIQPDLIIADEAHNLRHKDAARTKRVLRYLHANPECRFCVMSGTLTNRSIKDYAHLARFALRHSSPLPFDWHLLEAWAACIDSNGQPTKEDWAKVRGFFHGIAGKRASLDKASLRAVYRFRLVSTPGVVASQDPSVSTSTLLIHERNVEVPPDAKALIDQYYKTWRTPDGEEISDAMQFARVAKYLSAGFFYRWEWGPAGPNHAWLNARATWNREVRRVTSMGREGLDSPLLVVNALEARRLRDPALQAAWEEWRKWRDFPEPPTVPVWFTDYLIADAVQWARSRKHPVVLWYDSLAVEEALRLYGIPVFGAGTEIPKKAVTIAASIAVHGTGKNMQAWTDQLVITPPSSGGAWEQLLGRMHRSGQMADEVHCTVYTHTRAYQQAMSAAKRDAGYIEQSQGNPQKLNYAIYCPES